MTLEFLLAIVVFLMMAVVGTDVSRAQLAASLRMRRALAGATLGQLALLAGWLSGQVLRLDHGEQAVLAIEFGVRNAGSPHCWRWPPSPSLSSRSSALFSWCFRRRCCWSP